MGRPKGSKNKTEAQADSNVATLEVPAPEIVTVTEPVVAQNPVSVLDRYYSKIFSQGVLLQLHISRWGMSVKLSEGDLDITEKVPDIIRLGKKMLLKPLLFNQFAQKEQQARTYLQRMSNRFPISQAHFVDLRNLVEVRNQLDIYKREYDILTDNLIASYEAHKTEALAAYPDYADVLRPYYPALGALRSKFGFNYMEYRITMPKELETTNINLLLAEERKVEELTADTKARLESQTKQQLSEITNFVSNSVKELRAEMDSVLAVVVNKINKGEVVSDINKGTLLRKIEEFEKMNIFGDKSMAAQIAAVKTLMNENRDYKDKDNKADRLVLKTYLENAMTVAQNTSDISALTGEYFRSLEI